MNRLAAMISMALLATVIIGCEKSTETDKPDVYNPSVSAPPSNLNVSTDERIIKDQREISKQYSAATAKEAPSTPAAESPTASSPTSTASPAMPTGPGMPPAATPAGEPVDAATTDAVKAAYGKLIDACKAGDETAFLACFDAEGNSNLSKLLAAYKALQPKVKNFEDILHGKLQVHDIPNSIEKEILMPARENPMQAYATVNIQDVKLRKLGDIIVAGPDPKHEALFIKAGNEYKVTMLPEAREKALPKILAAYEAVGRILDAACNGMNDNTITAQNLEAKIGELINTNAPTP